MEGRHQCPLNFGCSHMEKRVFSKATNNHRTITMWVFGLCLFLRFQFHVLLFFFFLGAWTVTSHVFTIHALFITVHALKNIKNGPHDTIHAFKNYFVTVLSVFSFSNNKFNPNGSIAFFHNDGLVVNCYVLVVSFTFTIWKILCKSCIYFFVVSYSKSRKKKKKKQRPWT